MRIKTTGLICAVLLSCGILQSCAVEESSGKNEAAKRYFDAWIKSHCPDIQPSELGSYVLEDIPGNGPEIGDYNKNQFVLADYTYTDLNGNITETTHEQTARRVGTYNPRSYYGPKVIYRGGGNLYVGIDEMFSQMKVGGQRTFVTPGWLMTIKRYKKVSDYVKNESGDDCIYTFRILDAFNDIEKWETDSIARYIAENFPGVDTTRAGFWYIQTREPEEGAENFKTGDKVYFNYTGRRLDGKVFETTQEDTAKFYGIYNASSSYKAQYISFNADDYTTITMGEDETDVIDGFKYGLSRMKAGEKGICIFCSGQGYKYNGSGSTIPGYCPLRFDFEITGTKN